MATKEELLQELDVENRYSHLNTGRLLTKEEPSDENLKQAKDELKAWSPGTKHEQDIIDMMDELYPDSDVEEHTEDDKTTYTITWKDGDDVLKTTEVEDGEIPTFGEDPTKEGYNFLGWEPEIVPATEDTVYTTDWELHEQ